MKTLLLLLILSALVTVTVQATDSQCGSGNTIGACDPPTTSFWDLVASPIGIISLAGLLIFLLERRRGR